MKFSFAVGQQYDLDATLLLFVESRSFHQHLASPGSRVLHADGTAVARLDPMMEDPIRGQRVGTEACAGVINFKQRDGAAGAIFYAGFDVIGVAPGGNKQYCRSQQSFTRVSAGSRETFHSFSSTWLDTVSAGVDAATRFSSRSRRFSNSGRR